MKADEFQFFADFLRERSGISLDPSKEYLVEARMMALLEDKGIDNLSSLVDALRDGSDRALEERVAVDMAPTETAFFRDARPFEMLKEYVIPALLDRRAGEKELNIWSAGCASGQEPYSIAMVLRENFPQLSDWNVNILATDMSEPTLAQAREGSYSQLEVNRGLPPELLGQHFKQSGVRWQIKDDIREMVEYRKLNLVEQITDVPQVDIVFLRNVLIYFDIDLQRDTLGRIRTVMNPSSFLFLGNAETTLNLDDNFNRIEDLPRSGCYRLEKG